jgi:Zn-finger nucleic acid-binding protein
MTERQGVEIDYCPNCRGIWLDRGELDKLIERSTHWTEAKHDDDDHDDDHERYRQPEKAKRKRRGSFLGEIFEGFG